MTKNEYIDLGRAVVKDGRLQALQRHLRFSATYVAEILGVSAMTYRTWISKPETNLWEKLAYKVGRFYNASTAQLEQLDSDGIDLAGYRPLHAVAPLMGLPQEELLRRYREGEFPAMDLGILGLWVSDEERKRIA